jgi:hypothetical protein
MAPTIRTYPTPDAARQAVEELKAAGVQPRHIRLLIGAALRDTAQEPRGSFAGTVEPGAAVGGFAGRKRGPTGSFATGLGQGGPGSLRRGSFGDVERVVIVSHERTAARSRVTGLRGIRVLLRRAALDESTVDHVVRVLHKGHTVMLVEGAQSTSSDARVHVKERPEAA